MRSWVFLFLFLLAGGIAEPSSVADVASSTAADGPLDSDNVPLPAAAPKTNREIEAHLRAMSLRNKVGQLLMIGFTGSDAGESLNKTIGNLRPGAIIVFGRNIKSARQISNLNISAQGAAMRASKTPLLIAVDQEGGDVIRLKTGFPLPSALAIGRANEPDLAVKSGAATGKLLRTLGFNMNLAPVLDVADPKKPRFIGTRSYGNDPELVAEMAMCFALGLESTLVLPTTKHFPGHGGVNEDSHLKLPEKNSSRAELEKRDLLPFKRMQEQFPKPWAVMVAHVVYPALDSSRAPAAFSKPIIDGVLRKEIGFNGLVVTDDIEMAGAAVVGNIGERAIRAIEAGDDMIMIGWNRKTQAQVADALYKSVKSGRISEERINESVRRVLLAKSIYARHSRKTPSTADLRLAVQSASFKEIAEETLVARWKKKPDKAERAFVESAKRGPIVVFSSTPRFTDEFRKALPARTIKAYSLDSESGAHIEKIMRENPKALGVLYVSGNRVAKIVSGISANAAKKLFVVTVEAPGQLRNADDFRYISDVYYRHPDLGRLIAERYFSPAKNEERAGDVDLRQPANASEK
jgi:beta-N-acetylhexosaminidase